MNINFKPLNESHFPLLLKWLETPHVKKWWDQDITYTLDLVKEKFSSHTHGPVISSNLNKNTYVYIISLDNQNIGYIQAYNARDFAKENGLDLQSMAGNICGIDLFIGEPSFLNKGLCQPILHEFEKILVPHFDGCLIDPAKDNVVAIKAFEKSGFKIAEQFQSKSYRWMIKKLK